jgi:hypothetical protein
MKKQNEAFKAALNESTKGQVELKVKPVQKNVTEHNVQSASPLLQFDYTVESENCFEDHVGEQVLEGAKIKVDSVL